MRILALDLATKTGYALGDEKGILTSGTAKFEVKKFEGAGMRYLKFGNWLRDFVEGWKPDVVYFEGIRRHLGVDAAHVYGGLMATMQAILEHWRVPYSALTVQEIKKLATGKGNAKKDAMIATAKAKWSDIEIVDDNHADALWILEAARAEHKANPTPVEDLL